jgi:nicotinamide mononucleotide transporter
MVKELIAQFYANSIIDWAAFFFGVMQVVLAWKNKKINFLAGIVSVALYIYIFYRAGLFAESFLNIYYLLISIYGFIIWNKQSVIKKNISFSDGSDFKKASCIFAIAFILQWIILSKFTTSNVAIMDSMVSSIAWAGTWLLTKRKVENWIWLNVSNVLAIPLFIYKGLHLVALLYIVFFILAIFGYQQWKKEANQF